MKTYIYQLKLVERLYDELEWTEEDNNIIEAHYLRIKKDFEEKKIIHVGQTVDPKADGFGLVVYYAENDEAAKKYMEADPALIHHLMTATYQPYKVIFS